MGATPNRTPIALFVALTRAVREAAVPPEARLRAYEMIERMAQTVGLPGFERELEAFGAFATHEPRFFATLQPFWPELRSLSASSALVVGASKRR